MKPLKYTRCVFAAFFFILWQTGCATLSTAPRQGENVSLFPGYQNIGAAVVRAALDPKTWIPAVIAASLQIDDLDEDLSDWAANHTPIFGSQESAQKTGEYLNGAVAGAFILSAAVTPTEDDPHKKSAGKLKRMGIGIGAFSLTYGVSESLKDQAGRMRPDGSDNDSFPSNHASSASVFATLASRNLDSLPISHQQRNLFRAGLATLVFGTGWSRVEGKRHYPSDVLAGHAIGHFLGTAISDAFFGPDHSKDLRLIILPSRKDIMLGLQWAY
jgi:membrane-associated phospholipid phosphatase